MNTKKLEALIERYYAEFEYGGPLHIIIADENYDDSCVRFCIEESQRQKNELGEIIAKRLLEHPEDERKGIVERGKEHQNKADDESHPE